MKYYCELVNKDLSPDHKHVEGNCTTRALAFVLQGQMTYDEIWEKQHKIAKLNSTYTYTPHWNTPGIWDQVLTNKDYVWIKLNNPVRRDKLATILKNLVNPIISHSSGHVAIINAGTVVDNWDSRAGRVSAILVKKSDLNTIQNLLGDLYYAADCSFNRVMYFKRKE